MSNTGQLVHTEGNRHWARNREREVVSLLLPITNDKGPVAILQISQKLGKRIENSSGLQVFLLKVPACVSILIGVRRTTQTFGHWR